MQAAALDMQTVSGSECERGIHVGGCSTVELLADEFFERVSNVQLAGSITNVSAITNVSERSQMIRSLNFVTGLVTQHGAFARGIRAGGVAGVVTAGDHMAFQGGLEGRGGVALRQVVVTLANHFEHVEG